MTDERFKLNTSDTSLLNFLEKLKKNQPKDENQSVASDDYPVIRIDYADYQGVYEGFPIKEVSSETSHEVMTIIDRVFSLRNYEGRWTHLYQAEEYPEKFREKVNALRKRFQRMYDSGEYDWNDIKINSFYMMFIYVVNAKNLDRMEPIVYKKYAGYDREKNERLFEDVSIINKTVMIYSGSKSFLKGLDTGIQTYTASRESIDWVPVCFSDDTTRKIVMRVNAGRRDNQPGYDHQVTFRSINKEDDRWAKGNSYVNLDKDEVMLCDSHKNKFFGLRSFPDPRNESEIEEYINSIDELYTQCEIDLGMRDDPKLVEEVTHSGVESSVDSSDDIKVEADD